jgi:hypothetical protein
MTADSSFDRAVLDSVVFFVNTALNTLSMQMSITSSASLIFIMTFPRDKVYKNKKEKGSVTPHC